MNPTEHNEHSPEGEKYNRDMARFRDPQAEIARLRKVKESYQTRNNEPSGLGGLSFDWFAGIALLITVLIPAVLYFIK